MGTAMQVRAVLVLLLFLLVPGSLARGEEAPPDARAKKLVETYILERKEKSWSAFQRRLRALRGLGPIPCARARKTLLKVAKSGKTLDDRILAALGLARYGDLASVKELVQVLAKKSHPVLTQVVGEGLAATKEGAVAVWLAEDALELPDGLLPPILRAHAHLATPEAADRLSALLDGWLASPATIDLAFDALQALGRSSALEDQPKIFAASQHADMRIRLAAADVLALQHPEDEGVQANVKALLADDVAAVKRAMAHGIEAAKREVFVPLVTVLLEDEDPRTRKAGLDVLKRMTKRDFGMDAGAWRRWWEKRDTPNAPTPYTVPTYHGLPVFTERVAFVLDRSGSMRWPHARTETPRMEVAQDELVKVLEALSPRTRFNVLAFDKKVSPWKKGESDADPKSVAKAAKWVRKQESKKGAGTNTYGVLKTAYEQNPTIDTIYFLSDGIPEDGEITTEEGLLAAVRSWNRYRRVQIHAIALTLMYTHPGKYPITGTMRRAESFMRDLARIGHGQFKHVDRLPR